jgi:hypothetical protein
VQAPCAFPLFAPTRSRKMGEILPKRRKRTPDSRVPEHFARLCSSTARTVAFRQHKPITKLQENRENCCPKSFSEMYRRIREDDARSVCHAVCHPTAKRKQNDSSEHMLAPKGSRGNRSPAPGKEGNVTPPLRLLGQSSIARSAVYFPSKSWPIKCCAPISSRDAGSGNSTDWQRSFNH